LSLFKGHLDRKLLKEELLKIILNPSIIAVCIGILIMIFRLQVPAACKYQTPCLLQLERHTSMGSFVEESFLKFPRYYVWCKNKRPLHIIEVLSSANRKNVSPD
jgi:hypothetical protein